MRFRSRIPEHYRPDTCDIYAEISRAKGQPEVSGRDAIAYSSIKCLASKISNTMLNKILGQSTLDRYEINLPLSTVDYSSITIKVGYLIHLTKEGASSAIKLRVTACEQYYCSHWQVEAEEYDL